MEKKSKKDKQKIILKTAADIFISRGYYQTTMDEIAEKADVAKGTLYLYFKSKEHLFISLVEEGIEQHNEQIKNIVKSKNKGIEKLKQLIELELNYHEKKKNFVRTLVREVICSSKLSGKNLQTNIIEKHEQQNKLIQEIFIQLKTEGKLKDVKIEKLTAFFTGLIHSLFLFNSLDDSNSLLIKEKDLIYDMFLNGAGKK